MGKSEQHHRIKETKFKAHYENFTFQERKKYILRKAKNECVNVYLAEDAEKGVLVGLCEHLNIQREKGSLTNQPITLFHILLEVEF